jgi:hypothetical protein
MQSLLPKKIHKKTNLMEVKLTIHSIYWNMDLMLTRLDTYNKWIIYFNHFKVLYDDTARRKKNFGSTNSIWN